MNTPIVDFVKNYIDKDTSRLHMPGHKGQALLGFEKYDITEIGGADELYEAEGIIAESENNASSLFGTAHTYYSTEGSSHTIKAMLNIARSVRKDKTNRPYIIAARNIHKTFIFGCALLDIDVKWLYPENGTELCECPVNSEKLNSMLAEAEYPPIGVYLTSPDYLGNTQDIKSISVVCHKYNVPLLVDNAHGAYLKFLQKSEHPIDLGADIVCDSAHKTLPALTGAAYLHVNNEDMLKYARTSLSLFASTSPSYLIMQSLDMVNAYIENNYSAKLIDTIKKIDKLKEEIKSLGINIKESEKLKITIDAVNGDGLDIMDILRKHNVECEFGSFEHVVMMFTPESREIDFERIYSAMLEYSKKSNNKNIHQLEKPLLYPSKKVLTPREAVLADSEIINSENSLDRISAVPSVSCPPAVPIVISGEIIDENAIKLMKLYGIEKVSVVK